jgi:phenylalanyl-tRNA synthetase beta chain
LLRGTELYKEIADAKIVSEIIDIYPNPVKTHPIAVTEEKIQNMIGVPVSLKESAETLKKLGFEVKIDGKTIHATPPTWRADDVQIPEDIVEEIARIHGYHRLPSILPPVQIAEPYSMDKNPFYWEMRAKNALKYWGFTEVYTYSLVSEDMLEGPTSEAVALKNPLSTDMVYLRKTLIPSLLQTVHENRARDEIRIFEIANVYHKRKGGLPDEIQMLAGVVKKEKITFYEVKGIVEALLNDLGIKNVEFKPTEQGGDGADVFLMQGKGEKGRSLSEVKSVTLNGGIYIGAIEILEENLIDFEFNFQEITTHANVKKVYTPVSKFPPVIEDMRFEIPEEIPYAKIIETIQKQSDLITNAGLLDMYKNKKTFRITYQSYDRNLTAEDVTPLREKVTKGIEKIGGQLA